MALQAEKFHSSTTPGPSVWPDVARRSEGRVPVLDGWRSIAILLVLFEHIGTSLAGRYTAPWRQTGQHGVTLFFVLSGFLIASRLAEGPIDLKRFYLRRFFRLMPVAWAYLAALVLFDLLANAHFTSLREVCACLFFYRNFISVGGGGAMAGHSWSLSIEEQFYVAWPCLLRFAGPCRGGWFAAAGALVCAWFRLMHWSFYNRQWYAFHTEVRADALLIGCLFAPLLGNPRVRSFAAKQSECWTLPALSLLLFCIACYHWLPPLFESLTIGCLVAASAVHPRWLMARSLSWRPLTWLGTVSYSIYVWQQVFLSHYAARTVVIKMMCLMPLFALGSYYLIERRATRFGYRITSARGAHAAEVDGALVAAQETA